jgi:predicted Zn-dependent peptidase
MIYQEYNKTCLPNGLTVVSEYIPSVRSISLGVWIKTGTRFEEKKHNGVAHFLEHMMFKGTKRRTPRQIVRSIESLGGQMNAFTSKEQTCYYVEILDEHLPRAVEVLADILHNSTFAEKEFEKERRVILDEIQSLEDSPDEMIHDYFVEKLFPEHGLGYPILGTPHTVENIQREDMLHFFRSCYTAPDIVIAAAGNISHEKLIELTGRFFRFPEKNSRAPLPKSPALQTGEFIMERPIHQVHLCMGVPAYPYAHPRKFNLLILNTILGGGMGSRLFQNIRERHGIAYGIFSFFDFYLDNGILGVYLGTDKRNLERSVLLLEREFERLRKKAVPRRELEEAKSQLKGNLVLGLENTAARMNRLAMMEIYLGNFRTIDAIIEDIDNVTQDSLWETARELFEEDRFLRMIFIPKN